MIVRFAITPEAVHLNGVEPAKRARLLRSLVFSWGKAGRMVALGGDEGFLAITGELDNLPPDLRKMWKRAIQKFRVTPVPAQCPGGPKLHTEEIEELERWLQVLGCEPGRIEEGASGGLEVCQADQLTISEAFATAMESADQNLYEGMDVAEIWRNKVAPLFRASNNITIVDRYSFAALLDGRVPPARLGLVRIISACVEHHGKNVKIYGSLNDKQRDSAMEMGMNFDGIRQHLEEIKGEHFSGARSRITFQCIPEAMFGRCHDRFLVFDYQVLEVGIGLEILNGPKLFRGTNLSLKARAGTHDAILRDLSTSARPEYRIDWEINPE